MSAERAYEVGKNATRRKEIAAELGHNVAGAFVNFGTYPRTKVGTAKGVENAKPWLPSVGFDTWQDAAI